MRKYSLIELYVEEDKLSGKKLLYAMITYDDGTKEQVDNKDNNIIERINEFAKQCGMTLNEIFDDSSKIRECRVKSEEKAIILVNQEDDKKENNKKENNKKENNKKENDKIETVPKKPKFDGIRKKIIKLTAIGTALILAFVAGKGINLNRKKSSSYQSMTVNSEDKNNTNLPLSDDVMPTVSDNKLYNLANRINNNGNLSDEEMDYVLNEINSQCYLNVPNIENLIEGKNMYYSKEEIKLNDLFANDSFDSLMVLHFCSLRNNIVNNAENRNSNYTKNELSSYLNEIIDFTFNGKKIDYGNHSYNFYNLSPLARYIIVDLGMNWLTANRTYIGNINGQRCNYNSLVGEYAETFNTVTENLVNRVSIHK